MKRILSMLLLLTLLAGLVACGSEGTSSVAPTNATTDGEAGTETGAVTDSGEFSLENYTIDLTNHLTNENATDAAKAVYNFIADVEGRYIISGQQESPNANSPEITDIFKIAGTTPVIRGFDFINDDFDGVVMRAKSWWEVGGLVSICWHMGTPPDGVGYDSSKGKFALHKALQEGTEEHDQLMAYLDMAVPALKELQDAGIAVLWRPFHEADGAWFWWGKSGAEDFVALWKLMYNYYTNDCGLNNLIWVCGLSSYAFRNADWYPGDDYVDILGADIYASNHDSQEGLYKGVKAISENKIIALHECGLIPDPDVLVADGVKWSWFLTWTSTYLHKNTDEEIKAYYTNDYVLAMNRMPNITEQLAALK